MLKKSLLISGIILMGLAFVSYFFPTGEMGGTLIYGMSLCASGGITQVFPGVDTVEVCKWISYIAFVTHSILIIGIGLTIMGSVSGRKKPENS